MKKVIDFIHELKFSDIPPKSQEMAEICVLDLIGVGISGTTTKLSKLICEHAVETFGSNKYKTKLLFDGRTVSPVGAALAGGMTIDSIDAHDGFNGAKGHVGCGVFPAAVAFGVKEAHVFGFRDWVGGRYSLWGPVGLSIACSVGSAAFGELLAGARAMDRHVAEAPARENVPLITALLGVWYREYMGFPTHVVLPYAQDLDRFSAYLQQADMESNGKYVGRDGLPVEHATGPVVWGEAGTNGQHAFYQLLHQGTDIHPADIIAVDAPLSAYTDHHTKLLANAIAQAEALMCGRNEADVRAEMEAAGQTAAEIEAVAPHRVFQGNRPSTFILLDALNARSVGQLIALYEHRIFIQGLLWNVCSYDQWGVELGKVLAKNILFEWSEGSTGSEHDASTQFLIERLKR